MLDEVFEFKEGVLAGKGQALADTTEDVFHLPRKSLCCFANFARGVFERFGKASFVVEEKDGRIGELTPEVVGELRLTERHCGFRDCNRNAKCLVGI